MKKSASLFASAKFFYSSLVLFFFEASWIALSGRYSMAFDESTHLYIIRLYAQKWLPFWTAQPSGPAISGAVYRDPSYLYHYLISFPYRFYAHFIHSETAQVLFLRAVSIVLFMVGIVLFRRLLLRTNASPALVNVVMLLLVLTPIFPFLAAQLNYDNLLFPVVAGMLLLSQRFVSDFSEKRRFNAALFIQLGIVGFLGSLVKFAFLPVFLGIGIYLAFITILEIRRTSPRIFAKKVTESLQKVPRRQLILLGILLALSGGLFFERYGINTIRYGTPTPECDQVLSVDRCMDYSPWRRNYLTYQDKQKGLIKPASTNPFNYTVKMWGKRLTNELFFTVDGSSSNFVTRDPLLITRIVSLAILLGGLVLFLRWQRELRHTYRLGLLMTVTMTYLVTLWGQNYGDFVHLGFPFAIQGRYTTPILPIVYLLIAAGFNRLLKYHAALKPILAWSAVVFLCSQGGGAGIFILRSDASWDWPNHLVVGANDAARKFLNLLSVTH